MELKCLRVANDFWNVRIRDAKIKYYVKNYPLTFLLIKSSLQNSLFKI